MRCRQSKHKYRAIINPKLINQASSQFGNQCIVLAIDAKLSEEDPNKWITYTHGGRKTNELDAVEWAQEAVSRGAGEILLTSMDKDGTKNGYDIKLTRPSVMQLRFRNCVRWSRKSEHIGRRSITW